jgi:trehalose/maltose transport system permease protein
VLTSFFRGLPGELEEAAYADGARRCRPSAGAAAAGRAGHGHPACWPSSAPGTNSVRPDLHAGLWRPGSVLQFSTGARTAIVLVATFTGRTEFELPWGSIMAASVTLTIPLVLLVLFFQRRIMAGLTAGAVKG